MSNSAEAIAAIAKLVNEANQTVLRFPEDKHFVLVKQPDGTYEQRVFFVQPPQYAVATTDDLVEAIKLEALERTSVTGEQRTITINDSGIKAIHFNGHRSVVHSIGLPKHPAFKILEGWRETTKYTQKQLIRLLKSRFNGFVDTAVIARLSEITTKSTNEIKSDVRSGFEGVSQSVIKQVATQNGVPPIPESLIFDVPVYDTIESRNLKQTVEVLLDCTFDEGQPVFELTVVHEHLQAAKETVLEWFYNTLQLVTVQHEYILIRCKD